VYYLKYYLLVLLIRFHLFDLQQCFDSLCLASNSTLKSSLITSDPFVSNCVTFNANSLTSSLALFNSFSNASFAPFTAESIANPLRAFFLLRNRLLLVRSLPELASVLLEHTFEIKSSSFDRCLSDYCRLVFCSRGSVFNGFNWYCRVAKFDPLLRFLLCCFWNCPKIALFFGYFCDFIYVFIPNSLFFRVILWIRLTANSV
jgi:hypothetical protein